MKSPFSVIRAKYESWLDGPAVFQIPGLRRQQGKYRSPTLAVTAWIFAIVRARLTVPALIMFPAAATVGFYCTVAVDSPVRIFWLVFFAVAAVEIVFGWIFRPRLEIQRMMPQRIRAGSSFLIGYDIRNRRRIPAFNLHLDPFPYSPRLHQLESARVAELPGHGSASVTAQFSAVRRGLFTIYPPRAESAFPLGLLKWNSRTGHDAQTLSVYPAYHELLDFSMPAGAMSMTSGNNHYSKVGESQELIGSRDYREGDDIRHIDWRGSARRNKPVVREYEELHLRRVALLIDTYIPRSRRKKRRDTESPELEAALSLGAAITRFLTGNEAVVDLFAAGSEVHHLQTGRGTGTFEQLCDILSSIEPEDQPSIERLAPSLFAEIAGIGGAVVILLGDDSARRALVQRIVEAGAATRVILLGKADGALPENWLKLPPEAILRGEITTL